MKKHTILAIDVGTSCLKAGIYDEGMRCLARSHLSAVTDQAISQMSLYMVGPA